MASQESSAPGARSAVALRVELAFVALLLGMLLAQLDTNIVVAALPEISAELEAGPAIAGVTAAYLLTVTVTTPIAGKLGDVLGRRAVFIGSVLVFAVGSAACAIASSMVLLVAARGVQGVGGAGLVVTAVSTLAALFDKAELIRRQVWLTAVTAIAALAGPPTGGFLSAFAGWPAIFLVNLPICVVAAVIGYRGLPGRAGTADPRRFDVTGAVLLLVAATGVVVLGSFEGVARSAVLAPAVLALAVVAVVAFVRRERRAPDPLIPPTLFAAPGLARSIAVTGLGGVALFGTFTFVPLAVIAGTGYDVSTVSALLVALTAGQLVVTATFSVVARRFSRMVPWGWAGIGFGVSGLGLLAILPLVDAPGPVAVAIALAGLALAGAGLGLLMQAYTLLGITTAPAEHFGSAMATLTLARQLGGSIGAAGFGWVLIATASSSGTSTTVILGLAALLLAAAITIAPRRADEPS